MLVKVKAAAKSDVGMKRRSNQDSFGMDEDLGVYVVCDGMGGAAGGEVASHVAVEAFLSTSRQELACTGALNGQRNRTCLERAAVAANRAVRLRASNETRYRGMGSTLVGARVDGDTIWIVNVGDSRSYLVRDGQARQITNDHSFVAEQVRRGLMTEAEAEQSHMKSVIIRAIGIEDDVRPDVFSETLRPGDAVLLSSDGLTRHVTPEQIAEVLSSPGVTAADGCAALIQLANEGGGSDNVTCLVIQAP